MRFSLAHKPVILLTLFSLLASVLSAPLFAPPFVGVALAQDAPIAPATQVQISVQAQNSSGGTAITYDAGADDLTAAAALHLPTVRYGGYSLPMQLFVLQATGGSVPQVQVQGVSAVDLAVPPQPEAAEVPPALGWEPDPNYAPPTPALPTQPVFVVRQGAIRGQQVVVVAVSPIYAENGVPRIAGRVQATVTDATPMDAASLASLTSSPAHPLTSSSSTEAGTVNAATPVAVPENAAALKDSYRLIVAEAGLQEVLYSDLGLASEPPNLHLTLEGADVPVEKAGDRLRFYAPQAGDRWNKTTTYWLTLENGPAIPQRTAAAGGAALGAYEGGEWRNNLLYEPGYPGADGDHWFHIDIKAPAVLPQGEDITQMQPVTVPVATSLPLRGGASTYGVIATGYRLPPRHEDCDTAYQLHVQGLTGAAVAETRVTSWLPNPQCRLQTTSTATFSSDTPLTSLLLRLKPNDAYATAIKLEAVTWRRPVELDFQNVPAGAEFTTDAGGGSVALHNLPASWRLYDVTQPLQPQFVAAGSGGGYTLNQAAGAPASRYLLANAAVPPKPTVQAHPAARFGDVKAADAIYIGPRAFADELAPLLDLRRQQGYTPIFVDVQAIYDVFSYGQVSAVAIRNFLRSESDWQNNARQISVVLAGDATMDPFAYGGIANDTLVAAWMAEVDPYLGSAGHDGEVACDACIAQLNGDDPLTGDYQNGREWFAADVWLGRLPVRSEQEMADVVTKLVAYDTNSSSDEAWRMRKVFLADNYIKAIDANLNAKPDDAGDFAAFSDSIADLLPSLSSVRRLYYDPAPDRVLTSTPAPGGYYQTAPRTLPEGWRISDIAGINTQVIATLSQGAGLVTYNGHSNHFYYARTEDVHRTGIGDKWLLNAPEVSLLSNTGREFVMLSMTCYTSQFVKPAANGTLDEWLIRRSSGGAVAVWGPTGLSVVSGHELLQEGFMRQLIDAPGEQRLGSLVEAGYTHLLTHNGPLDPLMTFVLLGDPLTRARIPTHELYLPAVQR